MIAFSKIYSVYKRELKAYFSSPLAYVLLFIFVILVLGLTFLTKDNLIEREQAVLGDTFFDWHPWVYMIFAPAIAMRCWADEHRLGTIELVSTMPIHTWHVVVGKFLACCTVLFVALVLTLSVVVTVSTLGDPDGGPVFTGYLGSFLLGSMFMALATACSSLTRSQVISLAISVPICFLLIILANEELSAFLIQTGYPRIAEFVSSFSVMTPFREFAKGVVALKDLFYFLSMIALFLGITTVVLRTRRA